MSKKMVVVTSVFLLVVCLTLSFRFFLGKDEARYDSSKVTTRVSISEAPELTGVKWINGDSWLLVTQKNKGNSKIQYKENGKKEIEYSERDPLIGKNKILTVDKTQTFKYSTPGVYNDNTEEVNKYLLTVYNVSEKHLKKEKTIDMNVIANNLKKDDTCTGVLKLKYDENYILFSTNKLEEFYYLRLSDEKVFTESEAPQELVQQVKADKGNAAQRNEEYNVFDRTTIDIKKYGVYPVITEPDKLLEIYPDPETKPAIASLYPEINDIYKKNEVATIYYAENPPTTEEIISLIFPKGVDPWKNVTMKLGKLDGTKKKIGSLAEFVEYMQTQN